MDSKSKRSGYRINVEDTTKLCYQVLDISVHELVTGETPEIVLPKDISTAVGVVVNNPRADAIANDILRICSETISFRYLSVSLNETFAERFIEAAGDRFISCSTLCRGARKDWATKLNLPNELLQRPDAKDTKIALNTIIFVSVLSGIPIDYFVVRDYSQHLPLGYQCINRYTNRPDIQSVGNQLEQLHNFGNVKAAVSMLIAAIPEERENALAQILAKHF